MQNDFIIIEKNGKWYIPSKIIKLDSSQVENIGYNHGIFHVEVKPNNRKLKILNYREAIYRDITFNVKFSYIPEAGLMGVL